MDWRWDQLQAEVQSPGIAHERILVAPFRPYAAASVQLPSPRMMVTDGPLLSGTVPEQAILDVRWNSTTGMVARKDVRTERGYAQP